ncbi:hypothetical protein Tco_0888542 [Tanacetum coccineum]
MDDDSEKQMSREADDDIGYDPSDVAFTEWLWKIVNLKKKLLRNKAIMEGLIEEDDDESRYERRRRWNVYTNYNYTYETNHDVVEREELCKIH